MTEKPRRLIARKPLFGVVLLMVFSVAALQAVYEGLRDERYTQAYKISYSSPGGVEAVELELRGAGGGTREYTLTHGGTVSIENLLTTRVKVLNAENAQTGVLSVSMGNRLVAAPLDNLGANNTVSIDPWYSFIPEIGRIVNVQIGLLTFDLFLLLTVFVLLVVASLRRSVKLPPHLQRYLEIANLAVVVLISAIQVSLLIMVAAVALLCAAALFFERSTTKVSAAGQTSEQGAPASVFIVLLVVAGLVFLFNIGVGLNNRPFHQDENLHVGAALGYNETGEFAIWDSLNNEALRSYTRNSEYTWIVATMFSLFGETEQAARLPNVFITMVLAGLIGLLAWKLNPKLFFLFLVIYLVSVNDVIIYFARFVRGYAILMLLTLISVAISLYVSEKARSGGGVLGAGVALVLVFLISVRFHAIAAFQFSFAFFAVLTYIVRVLPRHNLRRVATWSGVSALALLALALIVLNTVTLPFGILNHIDLSVDLFDPKFEYFDHAFQPFGIRWPVFVWLLFSAGSMWKQRPYAIFVLVTGTFTVIAASLFFFDRYEDFRYISNLQPLIALLMAYSLYSILPGFFGSLSLSGLPRLLAVALCVVVVAVIAPVQVPYLTAEGILTRQSQANWQNVEGLRLHKRAMQPDNQTAYGYLFENTVGDLRIVKSPDDGIGWLDTFYLNRLRQMYPETQLSFWRIGRDGYIDYEYPAGRYGIGEHVSQLERPFFLVSSMPDLMRDELVRFVVNEGTPVADSIGVVRGRYGEQDPAPDDYFPQVWRVEE